MLSACAGAACFLLWMASFELEGQVSFVDRMTSGIWGFLASFLDLYRRSAVLG